MSMYKNYFLNYYLSLCKTSKICKNYLKIFKNSYLNFTIIYLLFYTIF